MTDFDLTVACDLVCGAGVGARCTDPHGFPMRRAHVERRRRAERHVGGKGERVRGADLRAIEDGAPSLQEVARDSWGETFRDWPAEPRVVKAWRVALACATLDKVYGGRAAPLFVEALARWNTPARVLLATPLQLCAHFAPLGLKTRRAHLWRLASERALYEPGSFGFGDSYESQSIRLVVDGSTSFEPDDKVLRVVRRRMLKGSSS